MSAIAEERRLFSLDQAAEQLGGVSPWTLRRHVDEGRIRTTRLGRLVRIPSEEIERIRKEGLPSLKTKEQ